MVTTTNFRDTVFDPNRSGGGHRPGGSALVLEERFTRSADDTLVYEFTMNDPAWYTAPWTARLPMARSDQPLYEFACHEGNYGLENILAGQCQARRAEFLRRSPRRAARPTNIEVLVQPIDATTPAPWRLLVKPRVALRLVWGFPSSPW